MIAAATPLRQSASSLRGQLLKFWVGGTLLLTVLLGVIDLFERHREVLADSDHVRTMATAALSAPTTEDVKQAVILNYTNTDQEDKSDGMNMVLLVNESGRIVYTSRPAWRRLLISDPLISQAETNDNDFHGVIQCFQDAKDNCTRIESDDFKLRTSSFTVIRPILIPRQDLGMQPEQLLLIVNYDPGVVLVEYSLDLIGFFLISAISVGLMTLVLWSMLASQMIPKLIEASHTDGLTQLMNRSLFMEQAKEILAEAEESKSELVFAILDLDYFKSINDTFGHDCGDQALIHVAEILRTVTRPDDLVCRFGGEEFALLLRGSRTAGGKALERLRLQLEMTRLNYSGHSLAVQTSIGASATADCGYNIDYLYTTSDKALYTAKKEGRNRVAWSDGRMLSRLARR